MHVTISYFLVKLQTSTESSTDSPTRDTEDTPFLLRNLTRLPKNRRQGLQSTSTMSFGALDKGKIDEHFHEGHAIQRLLVINESHVPALNRTTWLVLTIG